MDSKGFKEAAFSSIEEIVKYYDNIEDRRVVSNVEPGYLRKILPASAPEDGEPWKDIQKDMEDKIMPGITHWQSPNFMAFFPSASSFPGMLGEMWSSALTGAAFNWICSPAVTELETIVMDWLAQALALPIRYHSTGPTRGGGVIHGTASEAIVTVMVAARDKYLRETTAHLAADSQELDDAIAVKRSKLVALASASTHSSTKKAALIAGVRFHTIPVSAETGWALTGESVRQAVLECRSKGLEPFFLTTTMGTTDTCAVDAFDQIATALAEVAPPRQKGEIWVHVDAAFAGTALLCPEVRENSPAIQALLGLKDDESPFLSFNTNLHKWLLTNFDCSALWVSDRNLLIDSLSVTPPYLRNHYSDSGLVTDYRDWQIPLGRRFRSLKVWFVLRTYGIKGLQAHLRKTMKLGELFADLVKGRPDLFEILTGPSYALTVFKLVGASVEQRNARTKQAYEKINHEGKIYLTSTMLGEDFAIRVATSTPFVEEEHVRRAFGIIVEAAEEAIADQ